MKAISKIITGVAGAALLSVSLATPAEARHRDRRDRVDVGDIIAGAVAVGGVIAAADAIGNAARGYGYRDRYGYGDRYSRGYGERAAVNACVYQAERYGRGNVQITDVDRRGSTYRLRGVIAAGYDRYDRGYDRRYDRDYGRYDYDRRDRDGFTCVAGRNGRILDFRIRDRYASRW